jgi:N-methylhydantoinase B
VHKYGKGAFLHALEEYMNYGERVTLNALKNLPHEKFTLSEEQDSGQVYTVTIEITEDQFIVDLRDNPDQDSGPFNISRDSAVTSSQLILKSLTSTDTICNGGTFRPLRVLTREGSVFHPRRPAAMGIYYEVDVRLYDLIWRTLADKMPERLPAGGFASICGTLFGGIHPDTGRQYSIIEPELGGWGGSCSADGNPAIFSGFHGETFNCPAEINEARNGLYVDRMSLNEEEGGEGKHRGGKGVCIEYRIRSDNAWFTAAYTRSKFPPWPLMGGRHGSPNYVEILRTDGSRKRYSVVNALTLNTDDVIRVVTGTGAGWGNPEERDIERIKDDLKNGYITEEQANKYYKLNERAHGAHGAEAAQGGDEG